MKKNYVLLASALFLSVAGFSQEKSPMANEVEAKLSVSDFSLKSTGDAPKAFGDTMAYFDFDSAIPAGWTVYNNTNNNFDWKWADRAPGGQYSTNINALNSTTGANGFMMLESDSFNTPFPPGGPVAMDAYFQSDAIAIDSVASVLIRFQQSFRWCCSGSNILEMSVRAAGDTVWTDYSVKGRLGVNVSSPNPMFMEVNVSLAAAHADSIYIRFHKAGASHYYWMVDDIAIVEGPTNDMMQESFITQYDDFNSQQWQYYEQVPAELFDSMWIQTNIRNIGSDTARNVMVQYEVTQDTNCLGTAGAGSVALETMSRGDIAPFTSDTSLFFDSRDTSLFLNPFMAPAKGDYTLTVSVSADSTDEDPMTNSISNSFVVSDTVYAKDDGTAESVIGPGGYVDFDEDGARLLLYYNLPKAATLTSLSYYIPNSSRSDNTSFNAVVYGYDRNAPGCQLSVECFTTNPVASNPIAVNVDTSMFGSWITVPLLSPVNLAAGGYAIGYEATGFTATQDFVVGRDVTADVQAPYDSQFLYDPQTFIYAPSKGYGRAAATPMMRMNFGLMDRSCFMVGVEEPQTKTQFDIAPNPSNGIFSLGITSEVAMKYNLRVTNMLGQNVYNEEVSVQNNFLNKNMDLSNLDKGVYFVTLENGFERHTKKIIIK